MSGKRVVPYGEWASPISTATLTQAGRPIAFPTCVGERVWWAEGRMEQAGRTTVLADGVELLPAPWDARTRVHEYGGRGWLPVPTGDGSYALVFAHFADQRLYRLDPGADTPVPLTPEPDAPAGLRYADLVLSPDGSYLFAVRERHRQGEIDRHIVAVPVDGGPVREIVSGSRFLANPRLSPDGSRLAWLAWEHPNMPWDGTELRVGHLDNEDGEGGRVGRTKTVLGGATESVLQPEWADDEHLYAVSDRSGWWNLYQLPADGSADPAPLCPADEEFGGPLWQLGMTSYGLLPDGRLLVVHGTGTQRIGVLDPRTGDLTDFDLPYRFVSSTLTVSGTRAAFVAGGPTRAPAVVRLDTETGGFEVVRESQDPDQLPDPGYLPTPEVAVLTGPDGRDIHANVYPPTSPEFEAPAGEKPPYVVFAHGGPTSNSPAVLSLDKAFFTSRGIGVLDVNYGGSTGYGRAYRERLRGQWGVVDVQDCVAAARALVDRGDADPARLAIQGGSAGGWTTLCAVTRSEVFSAGMSLCGVTDVRMFNEITHDFESRYLDGLIGPMPESANLATERSPLTYADRTRCPVLLLQGADDPIVPLEQAEVFRSALVDNGIRHALLVFEGEQHGFRKAESVIAAYQAILSFYGQVLGFDPPGVERLELT